MSAETPNPVPAFAAAASLVVIYRKQRDDLKLGAEAGQSRAWAVKPTGPDPIGFLGVPRKPDEDFDNPLDTASGLFSIREDAQEVQRNPSNYSTTSRDALLLPSQPSPTDGSPRRNAGVQHGSPTAHAVWPTQSLMCRCPSHAEGCDTVLLTNT